MCLSKNAIALGYVLKIMVSRVSGNTGFFVGPNCKQVEQCKKLEKTKQDHLNSCRGAVVVVVVW